jgi:hypothetical protein
MSPKILRDMYTNIESMINSFTARVSRTSSSPSGGDDKSDSVPQITKGSSKSMVSTYQENACGAGPSNALGHPTPQGGINAAKIAQSADSSGEHGVSSGAPSTGLVPGAVTKSAAMAGGGDAVKGGAESPCTAASLQDCSWRLDQKMAPEVIKYVIAETEEDNSLDMADAEDIIKSCREEFVAMYRGNHRRSKHYKAIIAIFEKAAGAVENPSALSAYDIVNTMQTEVETILALWRIKPSKATGTRKKRAPKEGSGPGEETKAVGADPVVAGGEAAKEKKGGVKRPKAKKEAGVPPPARKRKRGNEEEEKKEEEGEGVAAAPRRRAKARKIQK